MARKASPKSSSTRKIKRKSLRMRVFAGPNGSGKSTIIQSVRDYRIKEIPIDFGTYVNADDIAEALRKKTFTFLKYKVSVKEDELIDHAIRSGLIGRKFPLRTFKASFHLTSKDKLSIVREANVEQVAQIVADYLRAKLLSLNRKFSFETVFSHPSKLMIMKEAAEKGYKVYLYYVSTESPDINIYRVAMRKDKGGHDVLKSKIKSRYKRSLGLMHDAAQLAYSAYFFDNSGEEPKLFAHFKVVRGVKNWDRIYRAQVPEWFIKYYVEKVK